ncbi:MAG TPA: fumarylacetoacetate hydrolase family protein [Egibacteraceae bacterium]|nr:fumarylacetoacetate hydrolase family protein [Egibacteraceae bacterium]
MRIVRVARPDGPAFGVVRDTEQGEVVELIAPHPFAEFAGTGQVAPLERVKLLAPVIPTKILAIGRNYADHAAEMGGEVPPEPLVFAKLPTTVIGPDDAIVLPELSGEVHHEAELAVVVKRIARQVPVERAHEAILGYTCANDVTARDLQRTDGQWTRAKGFDTFCPLGPWISTDLDLADAAVRCRVNGQTRQDGSTRDLVFSIPQLVSHLSAFTTLLPGDVILTGTPAGVGELRDGDTVEVEVGGIGVLRNPVRAEA